MVDWEVEGEGSSKRYLVYDQPSLDVLAGQLQTLIGRVRRGRSKTLASLRTSRALRDDESKVAGWVADLSEFDPLIDPALTGEFEVKLKDGSTHTGRPAWDCGRSTCSSLLPSGCRR